MCFMELQHEPSQYTMRFPLESIGVEDLTCMLVESIGVCDLVEFEVTLIALLLGV